MIKDYREYEFSKKEWFVCLFEGMGLNMLISILFFDSLLAMIPGIILVLVYFKEKRRILMSRRFYNMRKELKEYLNALIAALQTGRSIENSFLEALKDTARYLEKDTVFVAEMRKICAGVSVGEPIEKLMMDFARRSHLEELEYFAEVFLIGKRSGGNLISIMKNTIYMLQERMDAEEEIATVISEKRMEFYLMCIIPLAMIIYLRIGAGNFINCLYKNVIGIFVMTLCLIIYGGCYLYGKRILEIDC